MFFILKMLNVVKIYFFGNREKLKYYFLFVEMLINFIGYKFLKYFFVILYYDLFVDIFLVFIIIFGFVLLKCICFVCCI